MYHHTELLEMRVDKFARHRLIPAIERRTAPVEIAAWEVPGEPVPFAAIDHDGFRPFEVGSPWGRPWGTVWFRVSGTVPADWNAADGVAELIVDLGFTPAQVGFQAEGLVWSTEGTIIKAVEPRHGYVRIGAAPGEHFELFVEAASNPDMGSQFVDFEPTEMGRKQTAPTDLLYSLNRLELVQRDTEAWELAQDIWTLRGLVDELPAASPRRAAIIAALDRAVDVVDPFDINATVPAGRAALVDVLASPAAATAHRIHAVGHAHIDSAWLWPVRETIRKCARTFSNVLDLMDEDSEFTFACSSAQQFAWIKEYYPELFERIRVRVAEGRFIPVGGMWVESDTNMPSGEALVRQFVQGKGFFLAEFGIESGEVWLPDSFGYTGALPQIARAAGATYFLTQKISWNEVNAFPHHTFHWEGIDGTRVFTHFPPVDKYNAILSAEELAHAERNFSDKGHANTSLVPFGFGDGGGGPTREMLAAAHRTRSLEGSPAVELSSPRQFFEAAELEFVDPPVWAGELYLEFHRGIYTSQARTKRGNRRSEVLLHEAELWATTASVRTGAPYPAERLTEAWRIVLLQQFHDILPGSSIGWVHDQAVENYQKVALTLEAIIDESVRALVGTDTGTGTGGAGTVAFNAAPVMIAGVPAYSAGIIVAGDGDGVDVAERAGGYLVSNGILTVSIDRDGTIPSIVETASGREVVPPEQRANELQLFRDTPTQWDAWDVDIDYRRFALDLGEVESSEVVERSPERVTIRTIRSFGQSRVTQTVTLRAGLAAVDIETHVDWHERQKMLKLAFPIDVHTASATSEIQFGHIVRPTHVNTSWDAARFETPAHKWVHVSDTAFGVGVANDATYGHDITRHARLGGGTYSVVRETLLRAPLFPDPEADQGEHALRTSIVVGDIGAAIETGYRLNVPLREITAAADASIAPLVTSSAAGVVVETVKLAEDGSGDVVVRLYESRGACATTRIDTGFEHDGVRATDLLEREIDNGVRSGGSGGIDLSLRPFELVTLRFGRANRGVRA